MIESSSEDDIGPALPSSVPKKKRRKLSIKIFDVITFGTGTQDQLGYAWRLTRCRRSVGHD